MIVLSREVQDVIQFSRHADRWPCFLQITAARMSARIFSLFTCGRIPLHGGIA